MQAVLRKRRPTFASFALVISIFALCFENALLPVFQDAVNCGLSRNHDLPNLDSDAYRVHMGQQKLKAVPKPKVIGKPHTEFLATDHTFVGAREWHDLWTYASPSQRVKNNVDPHIHDDSVLLLMESTKNSTWQYLSRMKTRYANVDALPDFYARGIGWVYDRLGMVLTSFAVVGAQDSGVSSVFIIDTLGKIFCGGNDDKWVDRHPPLTMWVRVNGPEIFAGTAMPHRLKPSSSRLCAWRYDFAPKTVGEYSFHVKLLTFRGFADFDPAKCQEERITRNEVFDVQNGTDLEILEALNYEAVQDLAANGNFSHHRGISGFKFYSK